MTLEEAIQHSEEVAESYKDTVPDCDCAKQHRQLAEWLRELKYYREECETFKVKRIIQDTKATKKMIATARLKDESKKIYK